MKIPINSLNLSFFSSNFIISSHNPKPPAFLLLASGWVMDNLIFLYKPSLEWSRFFIVHQMKSIPIGDNQDDQNPTKYKQYVDLLMRDFTQIAHF